MTFDEWRDEMAEKYDCEPIAREAWQAAQKEAARRCAEIASNGEDNSSHIVWAIEREFGLDTEANKS